MGDRAVAEVVLERERRSAQAKLVSERFPDAIPYTYLGLEMFAYDAAEPNRLDVVVVADDVPVLVPYEIISDGHQCARMWRFQAGNKPVRGALDFLRERYPEAYAGLVEWASR